MLIASAKLRSQECKGSISPASCHGQLPHFLITRVCSVYLVEGLVIAFLGLLQWDVVAILGNRCGIHTDHSKLKMLTPKKKKCLHQRLPIALVQVKEGNNSENLLNEIRQTVYYLYHSKQITKKLYNTIIKSI